MPRKRRLSEIVNDKDDESNLPANKKRKLDKSSANNNNNNLSYEFKYKCTEDLFKTLIKINKKMEKKWNIEISNKMYEIIAMYGSGIKCKCSECDEIIYIMDANNKINKLIIEGNYKYYILHKGYYNKYNDPKINKYKLHKRIVCKSCLNDDNKQECPKCHNLMSPSDTYVGNDYDAMNGCYKCNMRWCSPCDEKYRTRFKIDWCARGGIECCASCLKNLDSDEKEY